MGHTLHDRDGGSGAHAPTLSLFLRVNVAAAVIAATGLLLPRVTASGSGLATVRTGYGQVFALLLLLVCTALGGWYATRADWSTTALLFVAWLGLLATAAFEVVRVAASSSVEFGLTGVGVGLYCNVAGAAIGAAAATIEAVRQWTVGRRPGSRSDRWLPWATATVVTIVTLAVVGVSGQLAGHDALLASARGAQSSPASLSLVGRSGVSSPDQSPVEGRRPVTLPSVTVTAPSAAPAPAPGTAGVFGFSGVSSGSGDTGGSGDWGMEGGLATYWPGYTGTPGSFYIWPGYLGPPGDTGATGDSGPTVTGASGLTGSGVTGGTGPTGTTGGGTGAGSGTSTTSTVPASSGGTGTG